MDQTHATKLDATNCVQKPGRSLTEYTICAGMNDMSIYLDAETDRIGLIHAAHALVTLCAVPYAYSWSTVRPTFIWCIYYEHCWLRALAPFYLNIDNTRKYWYKSASSPGLWKSIRSGLPPASCTFSSCIFSPPRSDDNGACRHWHHGKTTRVPTLSKILLIAVLR